MSYPPSKRPKYGEDVVQQALSRLDQAETVDTSGFIPSSRFTGAKPGYYFSRGSAGVGYYLDKNAKKGDAKKAADEPKSVDRTAEKGKAKKVEPVELDGAALLEQAEKEHASEVESQVEVLDVRGMKRLVLSFERKLRDNLEARMKYSEQPDKYVESEVDLDEEIRKLHALATAPKLYPELVRLNSVPSLLGLLGHENIDIAVDTVEVLHELTDGDVVEDAQEEAKVLVDCLLENNALESLVQCLARFDESVPEEATAVFNALGVLENMHEVKPEMGEMLLERTKLLKWLLTRVKTREFDTNKQHAAELLSILMQGSEANQRRLGAMNGVDALLQAVAMYKGREPHHIDEEEMLECLFDTVCWVVMLPDNKPRFVQAEGIELMLLVIKNKKYARLSAIKALDFVLTRCPAGCERCVDVLGLKSVFAAFMGKVKAGKSKRKVGAEELGEEEQRSVSIIASLFMGLSRGARRDRVGAKFVENEFEKCDRLVELFIKYSEQVQEAETKLREEVEEDGEELDEEELLNVRMDAGLYTLQLCSLILGHIWGFNHDGIRGRLRMLLKQEDVTLAQVRTVLQEHADTIGDVDGKEEREKRQKRINRLVSALYEDWEIDITEDAKA